MQETGTYRSEDEDHEHYKSQRYQFQEFYIPHRMMSSILNYVNWGIPPGDFLTAVICNDLKEAVGRADDENLRNIPAYVAYFYNEAPSPCWGSEKKMRAWIKKGGRHETKQ
jgi:hypothetical protein